MSALIIDGISASGKSFLLRALKQKSDQENPNFTKFHLTEHFTERFFEGKIFKKSDIDHHVVKVLTLVKDLQTIKRDSPFDRNIKILTITIERLFLTLMSRNLLSDNFFITHANIFECMDMRSVLLSIPEQIIEARLERSLLERNEGWRSYIVSLGGLARAVDHFKAQQDRMKHAHGIIAAHLPAMIIEVQDVSDLSEPAILGDFLWNIT